MATPESVGAVVFSEQNSGPCTVSPDRTGACTLLLPVSVILPVTSERSATTGPDVSLMLSGPVMVEGSHPLVVSPTATPPVVPVTRTGPTSRDPQIVTVEAPDVVIGPLMSES